MNLRAKIDSTYWIFVVATSFALQACTLLPPISEAKSFLDRAPDCCDSLSKLPFRPINAGTDLTLNIDGSSPAFRFPTGRSFFVAFELPRSEKPLRFTVKSYYHRDAFYPVATFLDSHFEAVRMFGPPHIKPLPPGTWERGRIEGVIALQPNGPERYVVLHTADSLIGQSEISSVPAEVIPLGRTIAFSPAGTVVHQYTTIGELRVLLVEQ